MTCAAIMTPNPHSVRADHTVGRAADELIAHRYINLPVVDEAGRLVGLFGMHDLLALWCRASQWWAIWYRICAS